MTKKSLCDLVKAQSLPRPEKAVLKAMVGFATRPDGQVWVKVASLVEETAYRERRVQYALRTWASEHLITDTGRKHRSRSGRFVPIYQLHSGIAPLGEDRAPGGFSGMHPVGCKELHPDRKHSQNTSVGSKMRMGNIPAAFFREFAQQVCPDLIGKYLSFADLDETAGLFRPQSDIAGTELWRAGRRFFEARGIRVLKRDGSLHV
jgi:hypothetical protein